MTIELKEESIRSKRGPPLELKVFYDSKTGDLIQVDDGNWLSPEDKLPGNLDVFNGAPDNIKFGTAKYLKTKDEKDKDGKLGRRVTYQLIKQLGGEYK